MYAAIGLSYAQSFQRAAAARPEYAQTVLDLKTRAVRGAEDLATAGRVEEAIRQLLQIDTGMRTTVPVGVDLPAAPYQKQLQRTGSGLDTEATAGVLGEIRAAAQGVCTHLIDSGGALR